MAVKTEREKVLDSRLGPGQSTWYVVESRGNANLADATDFRDLCLNDY